MSYLDYDSRMLAALEAATGQSNAGSGPFQDYDSRIQALLAYLAANGAGLTSFDTIANIETFTPQTAPSLVQVRGGVSAGDGGEGFFILAESEPAALTAGSTFHKRQDASGNWYERTFNGTIHAQAAGVFGNAVDCTDKLNDLGEWVGLKGGGKIILPPGVVKTTGQVVIDADGIELSGSMIGDTNNAYGTTWSMGYTGGPGCILGADGTERNKIKISNLKLTSTAGDQWCFRSRALRSLWFENIQANGIAGFLDAGQTNGVDGALADRQTLDLYLRNINTSFSQLGTKGFLKLQNCEAPLAMSDCHIEGNVNWAPAQLGTDPFSMTDTSAVVTVTHASHGYANGISKTFSGASAAGGITIDGTYTITVVNSNSYTITHGSAATSTTTGGGSNVVVKMPNESGYGIKIPVGGTRTDGATFSCANFHYFNWGYDLRGGGGNWFISNAYLDGMFERAFDLRAETPLRGIIVNNVHMTNTTSSDTNPAAHEDIAIDIDEVGGGTTVERISFTNCPIFHWGRAALNLQGGSRIKFSNNTLVDCGIDADNTYDAIVIGSGVGRGCDISGNTIDIQTQTNNPRYGINVDTTQADLRVSNNTILNCQTGAILNTNRGDARTRKIQGNSGQVYEGQIITIGPFSIVNAAQNVSAGNMLLSANASLVNDFAPARGRIMQWYICTTPVATVSAGTCTCRPVVNGSAVAPASSAIDSNNDFGSGTDADGVEFSAGDRIGMTYTTSADFAPSGSQELMGRVVVVFD